MDNSLFISRMESILTTMRLSDNHSITTSQVAQWINSNVPATSLVIAKACKLNILKKFGAAAKTYYQMSDVCSNSFESAMRQNGNDVMTSVAQVVDWFMNKNTIPVQEKKEESSTLTKISPETKQAILGIRNILKENEDLQAEVELLKEEVSRLKKYELFYNQISKLYETVNH